MRDTFRLKLVLGAAHCMRSPSVHRLQPRKVVRTAVSRRDNAADAAAASFMRRTGVALTR